MNYGTGETSGTSGTSGTGETSGKDWIGGRNEKAERAGSASQSQRMHGAGYVGAIVGLGENFEF